MTPDEEFVFRIRAMKRAGISGNKPANLPATFDDLPDLRARLDRIIDVFNTFQKKPTSMTFFVLYDIEDNKVRRLLAKYLLRKGCVRVQKSVFVADTDRKIFKDICEKIAAVNEIYENQDSIIVLPIAADDIRAMRVVGQSIDWEWIAGEQNTLFV
ncbi:MAG: CRISPR-associated endoribonuclease Cas2 [Bacteroidota bacterium]|jgi:CRISPR-associated protein Cas2